ncbi:MAG: sensor histidine kinase [Spirochaetia bacterium]
MHRGYLFPKAGLGKKIFISYVLTTFLPLVLINVFFVAQLSTDLKRAREERVKHEVSGLQEAIYLTLNDFHFAVEALSTDTRILDFLSERHQNIISFYHNFHESIRPIFSRFIAFNRASENVTLLSTNPYVIRYAPSFNFNRYITASQLQQLKQDGYLLLLHEQTDVGQIRQSNHILFIKRILAPFSRDAHAIAVTLSSQYLSEILRRFSLKSRINLSSANGQDILSIMLNDTQPDDTDNPYEIESLIPFPGTKEPWMINVRVFSTPKVSLRRSYFLYSIAGFLFILIVTFARNLNYSRMLSRRLSLLKVHSQKVISRQYETLPKALERDEISDLQNTMNTMTKEIKRLIEEVYVGQLREHKLKLEQKQSELHALQSRVNPHVFYNTIEAIRMRSLCKNEIETAEIMNQLGLLYRRTYYWKDDCTSVQDELKFVGYLFSIHKYRFGDKIQYEQKIAPRVEQLKIPKFTIQTLVENSLLHGIEPKGRGLITLTCEISNEFLMIHVVDNGVGIPKDKLVDIRRQITAMDGKDVFIGLTNAAVRLHMYYEGKAVMEIDSVEHEHTMVSIRIPFEGVN